MSAVELQVQAKALGDPTRYRIFRYVADETDPVGVAELTEHLGLNHNALTGLKDLQAVLCVQGFDPVTIDINPYATVPEPEAVPDDGDRQGDDPSDPPSSPSDFPADGIDRPGAKDPVELVLPPEGDCCTIG